ncbi:MAG: hypothetical protein JWM27_2522 [Gemmatimonadetes bacterium]|nr:hypothetical protein [Gemmatimonadota bacterium]
MPPIPFSITAPFIALVAALALALVAAVHRAAGWRRATGAAVLIAAWLGFTGVLAARGVLMDFTSLPPRLAMVVLPPVLLALAVGFGGVADGLLRALPPRWPVAAQVFRVGVEVLLARLAAAGLIAEMMTFHGANFDILAGLSAPFVAWLAFRGGRAARRAVVAWNACGLALLLNVVARGLLSAPTPLRMIVTDPPNTIVARFPVVWLPAFFVAAALLLHAASLRQMVLLRRDYRAGRSPDPVTYAPGRKVGRA